MFSPLNYGDSLFPTSYINSITKYPKVLPRVLLRPLEFINVRSRILAYTKQPPIPLTALAIKRRLRLGLSRLHRRLRCSIIWFGSSSGMAISGMYREGRSVGNCAYGWHVPISCVIGFLAMFAVLKWNPDTRSEAYAASVTTRPACSMKNYISRGNRQDQPQLGDIGPSRIFSGCISGQAMADRQETWQL